MLRKVLVGTALLLALVGCGKGGAADPGASPAPPADSSDGPLSVVDGEVQVNCGSGGDGWSPSVMKDGVDGLITEAEVRRTFHEALASTDGLGEELAVSGLLDPDPDQVPWRALRSGTTEDGQEYVTLGIWDWTETGPTTDRAMTVSLVRDGDGWRWSGMGGCRLRPALEQDSSWVILSRLPGGLDRDSTSLAVGVNELTCTGARDPSEFLHDPYVVETDGAVTVYWTSDAPEGFNTCQGSSAVEASLELAEPLGDRELLDGSSYPPTPVGAPLF